MDPKSTFNTTHKGNQYVLKVICMLAKYVMCVPVVNKSTSTVANAYLGEVYFRFEEVRNCFLTMEVNSKTLFSDVAS